MMGRRMRFRTAVTAFTGLMWMVEGTTLAAVMTPVSHAKPITAEMPCHHERSPAAPRPPCCDPGCIGMAACAAATVALTASPFTFVSPATRLPALAHQAAALPPPRIVFLLRPPIALHV